MQRDLHLHQGLLDRVNSAGHDISRKFLLSENHNLKLKQEKINHRWKSLCKELDLKQRGYFG